MKKRVAIIVTLLIVATIGSHIYAKTEMKKNIQEAYGNVYFNYVGEGFLANYCHFEEEHSARYFAIFLEGTNDAYRAVSELINYLDKVKYFSLSNDYVCAIKKAEHLKLDIAKIRTYLCLYPIIEDERIEIRIVGIDDYYKTVLCSIYDYDELKILLESTGVEIIDHDIDLQLIETIKADILQSEGKVEDNGH
ncbi:MAG: hypothetical protein MJ124_07005 [Lachnospiraceae bacterium]|nr:hypothetical protein [Lachnospiraceae bacterium]